ncbi:MAG: UDP-N-acetylmuramoyl-L-alanine--D-glutamate ligase [Bacilli bacterium]|nr:UDP-N-acetylmuramoyl-L-alanine--D-glutamate ligase [Bacilli bacterium]
MFENKKILILGFARSGYEAAKVLIQKNNKVILNDGKELSKNDEERYNELKSLGVEFIFGEHPDDLLDESFDYLIKNPGVPIDHKYVLKANSLNIPVINEVEMAYRMIPKEKNIKVIGITGTNGKTTTTTLIYNFLKESGKGVHLTGNIGYPLCSFLDKLKENDILVIETSCQQLENTDLYNPDVAVLTNISEAHIEFMKTYDHYKYVKSKIFKNHTKNNIAIINKENEESLELTKDILSTKKYISSRTEDANSYLKDGKIYYENDPIIDINNVKIKGIHNLENIMCAITAVKEFQVDNNSIVKVLENFYGVEHRLEYVGEIKGAKYYNDTEATNIKCTQIALSSFTEPTIIILGGYERGQDFNELKDFSKNIKKIIGIGQCRERVKEFGDKNNIPTVITEKLVDGFQLAKESAEEKDVVLLSPASASWDQYKQCEDRGDEFKEYVLNSK